MFYSHLQRILSHSRCYLSHPLCYTSPWQMPDLR
nr:MAG TPA: hypothetical protein [Caudoviricetes sp.]